MEQYMPRVCALAHRKNVSIIAMARPAQCPINGVMHKEKGGAVRKRSLPMDQVRHYITHTDIDAIVIAGSWLAYFGPNQKGYGVMLDGAFYPLCSKEGTIYAERTLEETLKHFVN